MADVWTVLVTSLLVRDQPSTNGNRIKSLYKGQTLTVDQISGNWVHHNSGGWSCYMSASGKSYISRTQINDSSQDSVSPPANNSTSETKKTQEENLKEYEEEDLGKKTNMPEFDTSTLYGISNVGDYLNNISNDLSISSCRGIHGMPYQFMPIVDSRISNEKSAFGRKYADKIVSRLPVLCVTPGDPIFLNGYSSKERKSILNEIIKVSKNSSRSKIDDLLKSDGKFYSIKFTYKEYYDYVNTMCRQAAFLMGLEDERINGVKLANFDWYSDIQSGLNNLLHYTKCVAFYLDSEKSISENYSNSTSQSMLANNINGYSDMGRELQFLLGNVKSNLGLAFDRFSALEDDQMENIRNTNDFIDNILGKGNNNIFKRITGNIQTIVSGGKLIFPEIWSDSSFSRSYSVNQTLVSPDSDDLSIYINIIVPMLHWIALAAPRSSMANGYSAPFLIKACYKGLFNVDMGIIEGLSFSKGDEGYWTRSGLPTVVKVSADIKDLYSAFAISDGASRGDINVFNNTILMDYIANLCGVNINEEDVFRNIKMYLATNVNKIRDQIRFDVFRGLDQVWTNAYHNIYRKLFF